MSSLPATSLIAEIKRMAETGLGHEDIAVKLGLDWRHVRKYVIGTGP